jgi:chromate transport protein ChrA
MIERLRAAVARHTASYPADPAAFLAMVIGLMIVITYSGEPLLKPSLSLAGGLYIAVGFAALAWSRMARSNDVQNIAYIALTGVTVLALLIQASPLSPLVLMAALLIPALVVATRGVQTATWHSTAQQSSRPAGNRCSGARRYSTATTAQPSSSAIASSPARTSS